MSIGSGFKTFCVWQASVLTFLYGWDSLSTITDYETEDGSRKRTTEYFFAIPTEDAKIDIENYESGQLALADAKSFVHAFNCITQTQNSFRKRGQSSWASKRWIEGR